jgi:hypothetical protein
MLFYNDNGSNCQYFTAFPHLGNLFRKNTSPDTSSPETSEELLQNANSTEVLFGI